MTLWSENTGTLYWWSMLPLHWWSMFPFQCNTGNASFTVVFLINRHPSKVVSNISPYEKFFLKPLEYNFRRVFVCLCYPLLIPYNKHKLGFRSAPCVFLGYCSNQHGYKYLDSSGCVYVSWHVRFQESVFPFAEEKWSFMQSSTVKNTTTSAPFFLPINFPLCYPSDYLSSSPLS